MLQAKVQQEDNAHIYLGSLGISFWFVESAVISFSTLNFGLYPDDRSINFYMLDDKTLFRLVGV